MPRPQERLQDLWEVYQRLGLEDDIVDPSNALLREGPVLKISFRRRDPAERYLFLVGEGVSRRPGLPRPLRHGGSREEPADPSAAAPAASGPVLPPGLGAPS